MSYYFFYSGPFSNFYPCSFYDCGNIYNCVEQYMMAHKAMLFADFETYNLIMAATRPSNIKVLGRQVQGFNPVVWNFFKYNIVKMGCFHKFEQNGSLRQMLLNTGDSMLVEASPDDRIWGIGFNADVAPLYREAWGQNLLGQALTEVKALLLGV